jgi:hypothetical protein
VTRSDELSSVKFIGTVKCQGYWNCQTSKSDQNSSERGRLRPPFRRRPRGHLAVGGAPIQSRRLQHRPDRPPEVFVLAFQQPLLLLQLLQLQVHLVIDQPEALHVHQQAELRVDDVLLLGVAGRRRLLGRLGADHHFLDHLFALRALPPFLHLLQLVFVDADVGGGAQRQPLGDLLARRFEFATSHHQLDDLLAFMSQIVEDVDAAVGRVGQQDDPLLVLFRPLAVLLADREQFASVGFDLFGQVSDGFGAFRGQTFELHSQGPDFLLKGYGKDFNCSRLRVARMFTS